MDPEGHYFTDVTGDDFRAPHTDPPHRFVEESDHHGYRHHQAADDMDPEGHYYTDVTGDDFRAPHTDPPHRFVEESEHHSYGHHDTNHGYYPH